MFYLFVFVAVEILRVVEEKMPNFIGDLKYGLRNLKL